LIDRSPLNLVQKLGLPAEDVAGRATVRTTLFFPLLAALKLEEIEVDARAELNDVRATLAIGRLPELRAESEALSLTATTSEMRLSGDARLEDAPVTVEWRERYGAASGGRSLALEGTLTPALLAQRGSPLPGFTGGSMAATLALTQETGQPAGLRIEGDLAAAALSLPEIGWEKAVGVPGAVALAGTVGEGAAFDTLRFDAPGLLAEGSASLDREGGIETLRLTSLKLDDRVDLAVDIARGSPGAPEGYSISATGALFDIGLLGSASSAEAERGSDAAEEPPIPIALDFEIAALRLNDEITLRPAQGRVSREASGALGAVFDGAVGGTAAVAGQIALPKDGDGTLGLGAPDAGAFLRAIDVASEASGGQFALDARLSDGGLDAVDGTVVMQNIRLTEGSAFNRIVRQGEGSVTIETDAQGGFSFRDVTMPFSYRSGEIRLSDAIATGPALAVRLGGRVDPVSDDLDLRGVISPAYALTGFLNNVPVLGQILTGSRGEGIFGMTFQVRGSLNDPDISVNPFSLLAPGILRRLFTVGVSEGDENPARDAQSERFREQLGPKR
ncbi:MAG: AsmA-like C-terminal domain-containing protein, partial [Pseudomonadota bacterium]